MEAIEQEPKERKRSGRRIVSALFLLLLVALLIDGVYVGVRLAGDMLGMADDLQTGADEFREGDFISASASFEDAEDAAKTGRSLLKHPAGFVAGFLPVVGSETDAVERLMRASEATAGAGVNAVAGARELGIEGDQDPAEALVEKGRVKLPLVEAAEPYVTSAAEALQGARRTLEGAEIPRLGLLRTAFEEAQDKILEASATATDAANAVRLLPELLGAQGTRRYFLAFQTLNEQRATGGVIGAYGILEAKAGRMRLVKVAPIAPLTRMLKGRIEPPPNFSQFDIDGGSTLQFQQVNQMAHWPTAARGLLAMYERATGESLDGVIAMDQVALGLLMRGAPPIDAPILDTEVTAANVVEVVSRQGYEELNEAEQNVLIVGIVKHFWDSFAKGALPARELAEGINDAIDTKHLKLFSLHGGASEPLAALEADDDLSSEGPHVQMVYGNNYSANKVDYFVYRDLNIQIEDNDDGLLTVNTTITYQNRAPSAPVTDLIRNNLTQDPPGTARSELCTLLPVGAKWVSFDIDGKKYRQYGDKELGRYRVGCGLIDALSGDTSTMTHSYAVPQMDSLTLYPQAVLNPDTYRVTGPDGEVHKGTLTEPVEIPL